jgi:chromosome segregation ATPase
MIAANRRLAKAEGTLGVLGWQQADFDERTQAQVTRLVEFEREQARATNESAAVGSNLREVNGVRDAGRQHFEQERGIIESERRLLLVSHSAAERQLAEKRRIEPTFEKRMPELDRELREATRLYGQYLAVQPHTTQIKQELRRLRERSVAIPNEKADLRMQHLRTATEIRALEAQLEREQVTLNDLARRERELTDAFKQADGELADQIKELEKRRAVFDKEFESLEGAKANPYREVGRVLADCGIAPVNQPQALEDVQRHRLVIQEYEHALAVSAADTESENPASLRRSLRIWIGLAIGVVVLLFVLVVFR